MFNGQEIEFKNVNKEFKFKLMDITGKEKQRGKISSSNAKIKLDNNLENGVYSIIIENAEKKISKKFIYRKIDS